MITSKLKTSIQTLTHTAIVAGRPMRYQTMEQKNTTDPREAIVLVHGLSGSSYWWRRNVAALSQRYRLYLIDLPGFGSMRREHRHFKLTNTASWLLQWMENIGLKQAHFIGHSMGGLICAGLAAERPEAILSLILVAPAIMPPHRLIRHYVLPLWNGIWQTTPIFWPILTYDALRTGPLHLIRTARQIFTHNIQEQIRTVKTPTLLIWGKHDTLVPAERGLLLAKEMPCAKLIVLPQAGHVCMFDQAQIFNKNVLQFLQRL